MVVNKGESCSDSKLYKHIGGPTPAPFLSSETIWVIRGEGLALLLSSKKTRSPQQLYYYHKALQAYNLYESGSALEVYKHMVEKTKFCFDF